MEVEGVVGDSGLDGVEFIGVPFDGFGNVGNQASASGVLRAAGLWMRLGRVP